MDKVQTGLRIPMNRYEELLTLANASGASLNSIVLALVEVGLHAINLGSPEALHSLLRKLEGTCG